MGRKKIRIHKIDDIKNREVTFNKRKVGLMKKAIELSVLCDCEVAVIVFHESHLYQYSSEPSITRVLDRYMDYQGPYDQIAKEDLDQLQPGKASSFRAGRTFMKQKMPIGAIDAVVVSDDTAVIEQNIATGLRIPSSLQSSTAVTGQAEGGLARKKPRKRSPDARAPMVHDIKAVDGGEGTLLTKRGRKRSLNVHIPQNMDAPVIEVLSSQQSPGCVLAPNGNTSCQQLPSASVHPGPLFSPSARYARATPSSLVTSMTSPWAAMSGMSPQYLRYPTQFGPGGGGNAHSFALALSPFSAHPPYSQPPSPSLPLATYHFGQI